MKYDISTATVSSVSKLEKWVDDVSVLADDAKLAFSPGLEIHKCFNRCQLFNEITLAKALIRQIMNIQILLNMDNEEVRGLHANLMLGIM